MYCFSSSLRCLSRVFKSPEMARKEEGGRHSASLARSAQTLGLRASCCGPECGIYTPTKCRGWCLLDMIMCTILSEMKAIDLTYGAQSGLITMHTPDPLCVGCPLMCT